MISDMQEMSNPLTPSYACPLSPLSRMFVRADSLLVRENEPDLLAWLHSLLEVFHVDELVASVASADDAVAHLAHNLLLSLLLDGPDVWAGLPPEMVGSGPCRETSDRSRAPAETGASPIAGSRE